MVKIAFALLLALPGFAQASEIVKVFDGTAAYCPPTEAYTPIAPEFALRAEVVGNDLKITLNTCVNGKWTVASSLDAVRYTAPSGKNVELQLREFRILARSSDWMKNRFVALSGFETSPEATVSLNDLKLAGQTSSEISLVAVQTTLLEGTVTFVKDLNWGEFRLTF